MIEFLASKPGVIALRVRGHVGREDVDTCFERLAQPLADQPAAA